MTAYDFLKSVLVVEIAQLGMDTLGGHLADMGARVIKIEGLPGGDPVRYAGDHAIGDGEGAGFMHLRWNRGKQSVSLDLRQERGKALFRQLVTKADILVEGLKGGALDRMGLGHEHLRRDNPALVHCSLSGLGLDGPYHRFRSHAVAYDAYAGLIAPETGKPPPATGAYKQPPVGMIAPGLFGALGVLSALVRARETGEGAFLEVAAADVAACWLPDGVDSVVNEAACRPREGFADRTGRMMHWPRIAPYETQDGRILLLEALAWPTWEKFCRLIERDDLLSLHEQELDDIAYHARLQTEITAILKERTLDAWMADFTTHDISAMPVNDLRALAEDPHYRARANWYDVDVPGAGTLRLSGTPIRVPDQSFAPPRAPDAGEHTLPVLADILDLPANEITALREAGIIA